MPVAEHLLLVNPSAGAGRALKYLPAIEAAMATHGLHYRTVRTTGVGHGCDEARRGAAAGEIPVVVSGDGLIGKVGGALIGTGAPLGVIPGGRGNDLARVVGIPTDPAGAVAVLAAGERRRIDVGEVNGERFLCIASCGFDSDANRIANEARAVKGPLVYAYAALKALWQWRPARFTVTIDGIERHIEGYSVGVANSKAYGGGMYAAPGALLDDGVLDVVTVADMSKRRFLTKMLPKVFKGEHVGMPEVESARGGLIGVSADRPFAVFADGDHVTDLPATFRVLPAALDLIAPGEGP